MSHIAVLSTRVTQRVLTGRALSFLQPGYSMGIPDANAGALVFKHLKRWARDGGKFLVCSRVGNVIRRRFASRIEVRMRERYLSGHVDSTGGRIGAEL